MDKINRIDISIKVAAFVKTYFKTPGVAATLPREAGNIIISKLSKVWGNPKTWNKTLINQIGVLRKVLPLSALKNLPANTLRDTFTDLGKQSLKAAQRAALGKRAIEVYGNPKNWTAADLSNIGSIAKSGRIMLNHIKQATSDTWGKVKSWTSSHVKQLGSLVTGLSTSDFDQLSKSTIQDSLSTLKTHVKSLRKVARRKIIKKLGSDFRTMLANISDFVQDIPFRNLTDITFGNLDATGDSQPNWSKGQALKLINLYLDEYGDISNTSSSNYGFENIRKMGSLVTGMTHANLSQLPFDGCIDTLTVLTARTDWSIGQIKVLYRMFKACMAITSAQNFSSITTDDLTAAGQVLSFLTPEEIGNMTNATCREAIRTIGSSGNFDGSHILAYQRRLDAALRCYEKNNNKNFTDDDILSFGKLVCGMQVAHIKRIPNDVLSNHLYSICRLRCLSSTLKKEIANRTKMAVGYPVNMANPMQALPSETVRDLGPCLDGFTSAELNKLNPETIRFSADSFNGEKFLAATKAVIVAKYFETYNVTRRRRATSTVTSYDILSLGSDLSTGLTVNDINNMDNATFADSVETLGNASLSKDQIYALAARAKQYWGSLDHFGPDTISALGIIMTGFNSSDIAKLNLTDSDAISALGEQSWDSSQLTELIARIKNNYAGSDVATWTADHFLAVKNMIAGLSTSDLSKIDQQAYENAADTIGVVPGMSLAQLQQLCSKAKGSFGSTVSTWETASVRTAGVALGINFYFTFLLGGCDSADLSSLSNDAINAMKANAIKNFPGSQLAKFTSAQIGQFDESQASAITATQKSSLSSAQVQALNQAQQGDNYVSDSSTSAPSATTAPALATTKTSAATAIRAGLSLVASIVIAITML
ncbi:expressed hypothetical protein [Trichoplax adhaerens]|uniref:Otoancorin n=1 Tax=Trichoplax adhaerens TaxID=10228 RepID=B3RMR4_TRIAD|nr:expressed hypothetical protein [Trichoplax adhaerens]EDV27894.1 expressed hypothetical protein [Trichoplax adhaerens]|eukprot:XP_002109728.1 expressed hypothetical protein [Trichoplax adhaerens]